MLGRHRALRIVFVPGTSGPCKANLQAFAVMRSRLRFEVGAAGSDSKVVPNRCGRLIKGHQAAQFVGLESGEIHSSTPSTSLSNRRSVSAPCNDFHARLATSGIKRAPDGVSVALFGLHQQPATIQWLPIPQRQTAVFGRDEDWIGCLPPCPY